MKIINGGDGERFKILAMSLPIEIVNEVDLETLEEKGKKLTVWKKDDLNPLKVIENAGRTCYRTEGKIEPGSEKKFVEKLRKVGHHAMIEHSSLTVKFFDTSRGFTHELVRHRLAAFGQESTRYVDESKYQFVIPPQIEEKDLENIKIDDNEISKCLANYDEDPVSLDEILNLMKETYNQLIEKHGWAKQDARQFLPIGITNDIVITANFREWIHIFKMRTSPRAHWEIRSIMVALLEELQKVIPVIFDDFEIQNSKDHYGIRHALYKSNIVE